MNSKQKLFEFKLTRELEPTIFIIDDFYENPDDIRKFALSQEYYKWYNVPGKRTNQFYIEKLNNYLNKFSNYYCGTKQQRIFSSFQYNTSMDTSWYHTDSKKGYAGIVYLTPDAPLSSGTGLFTHESGISQRQDVTDLINNDKEYFFKNKLDITFGKSCDNTKWHLNSSIGNVYNRLVIYKSCNFHRSLNYFGTDINDSRLIQIIFFENIDFIK
jgi:hypothetical protein